MISDLSSFCFYCSQQSLEFLCSSSGGSLVNVDLQGTFTQSLLIPDLAIQ